MRRIIFMYKGEKIGVVTINNLSFEYILDRDGIDKNKIKILEDELLDKVSKDMFYLSKHTLKK